MKYFILLLNFSVLACSGLTEEKPMTLSVYKTFSELAPLVHKNNDTTYVINFWATTCPPCRKEMPHFEKLQKDYSDQKLRISMISLDMEKDIPTRVIPYLEKYKMDLEFGLLADQNYSDWVGEIDSTWYGALPATLIYKGAEKKFYFGAFEGFIDLQQAVGPFLGL